MQVSDPRTIVRDLRFGGIDLLALHSGVRYASGVLREDSLQPAGWVTSGRILYMRKIIVLSFITLDGVMQGPGGPNEDTSGGFKYGGWTVPYFDEFLGNVMTEQMSQPFDLLLGR